MQKKQSEQEDGKFAEKERDSEEVMRKIRRVGRSELEKCEIEREKGGQRGRKRKKEIIM